MAAEKVKLNKKKQSTNIDFHKTKNMLLFGSNCKQNLIKIN